MPKLSEQALEKRFTCDYCNKTFRTRQGLSGHIQFKHLDMFPVNTDEPKENEEFDGYYIFSKVSKIKTLFKTNELDATTNATIYRLLAKWGEVVSLFIMLDLEYTEQDLKNYLVSGLGRIFADNSNDPFK